jgi:hypothetical protein
MSLNESKTHLNKNLINQNLLRYQFPGNLYLLCNGNIKFINENLINILVIIVQIFVEFFANQRRVESGIVELISYFCNFLHDGVADLHQFGVDVLAVAANEVTGKPVQS